MELELMKTRFEELAKYLDSHSKQDLNAKTDYVKGLEDGHYTAFSLCARWIKEILED